MRLTWLAGVAVTGKRVGVAVAVLVGVLVAVAVLVGVGVLVAVLVGVGVTTLTRLNVVSFSV